jgi:hypothetical protein
LTVQEQAPGEKVKLVRYRYLKIHPMGRVKGNVELMNFAGDDRHQTSAYYVKGLRVELYPTNQLNSVGAHDGQSMEVRSSSDHVDGSFDRLVTRRPGARRESPTEHYLAAKHVPQHNSAHGSATERTGAPHRSASGYELSSVHHSASCQGLNPAYGCAWPNSTWRQAGKSGRH